jgi:hypothetical protein
VLRSLLSFGAKCFDHFLCKEMLIHVKRYYWFEESRQISLTHFLHQLLPKTRKSDPYLLFLAFGAICAYLKGVIDQKNWQLASFIPGRNDLKHADPFEQALIADLHILEKMSLFGLLLPYCQA